MRQVVSEIKMKIDLFRSYISSILQILLIGRGSTGHSLQ